MMLMGYVLRYILEVIGLVTILHFLSLILAIIGTVLMFRYSPKLKGPYVELGNRSEQEKYEKKVAEQHVFAKRGLIAVLASYFIELGINVFTSI
jgi:hypothetical protein